jgi:hypothetical protein
MRAVAQTTDNRIFDKALVSAYALHSDVLCVQSNPFAMLSGFMPATWSSNDAERISVGQNPAYGQSRGRRTAVHQRQHYRHR